MPNIEYIIVTSDYNPKFVNFLPTISHHWRSMGYKVVYGLVASHDIDKSLFTPYCDEFHFWNSSESKYPGITLSKLYRFYLTKFYANSVVCVQDIDYYVCDKNNHVEKYIKSPETEIYVFGTEAYYPTPPYPEIRKFPATPTVSFGKNIYAIFGLGDVSYEEFLKSVDESVSRLPEFDDETSVPMVDNRFSDERCIRKLMALTGPNIVRCNREDCNSGYFHKRIDRANYCQRIVPCPCKHTITKNICNHSAAIQIRHGVILDIQPMRPLDTQNNNMREILTALNIPTHLIDTKIL